MRNNDCNRGCMPNGMIPFIVYGYPVQSQMMNGMCDDCSEPFAMPEIPSIPQQMAHGTPGAFPGMSMMWPFGIPNMSMMGGGCGMNTLGVMDGRCGMCESRNNRCSRPERDCGCIEKKCCCSSSCAENTPRMGVVPSDLEEEE
mgnify:CR=1 FL=1